MNDIKIGIIGCGTISSIYMQNIPTFNYLSLIACADLDINKARTQAKKHQIPKVYSVDELLNDPEIDLVINLTIPKEHRSEEHTSELQSRGHLVCRLLLEKEKEL